MHRELSIGNPQFDMLSDAYLNLITGVRCPNRTSIRDDIPFDGLAIARYLVNGVFSFAFLASMADAIPFRNPVAFLDSVGFSSSYFLWASSPASKISCYTEAIRISEVSEFKAMS